MDMVRFLLMTHDYGLISPVPNQMQSLVDTSLSVLLQRLFKLQRGCRTRLHYNRVTGKIHNSWFSENQFMQ